jgi:hypothetical protein
MAGNPEGAKDRLRPTSPLLSSDKLLTVGQLAKLLPGVSAANHAHRATVRRWTQSGVTIKGRKVRLKVQVTPGGQRLVRWGDYLEFRRQCDERRGETPADSVAGSIITPAAEERETRAAREAARRIAAELRRGLRKGA